MLDSQKQTVQALPETHRTISSVVKAIFSVSYDSMLKLFVLSKLISCNNNFTLCGQSHIDNLTFKQFQNIKFRSVFFQTYRYQIVIKLKCSYFRFNL